MILVAIRQLRDKGSKITRGTIQDEIYNEFQSFKNTSTITNYIWQMKDQGVLDEELKLIV